jgi:hypothetical protein
MKLDHSLGSVVDLTMNSQIKGFEFVDCRKRSVVSSSWRLTQAHYNDFASESLFQPFFVCLRCYFNSTYNYTGIISLAEFREGTETILKNRRVKCC